MHRGDIYPAARGLCILAFAALGLLGCRTASVAPPAASISTIDIGRCVIAKEFVANQLSVFREKDLIFDLDIPGDLNGGTAGAMNWHSLGPARTQAGPPADLIEQYQSSAKISAIAHCPAIQRLLRENGIPYLDGAVASVALPSNVMTEISDIAAIVVGLPTLSRDGRHAVIPMAVVCGRLCASGNLYYLRLSADGSWESIGTHTLFVS